ncbi:unnamed protein product [Ophioblennius macclurei]
MDSLIQAEKLKRWATNEFHRPLYNLPSDYHFRQLCAGPWRNVWMYLTDHVFQQRNVKIIRGNLRWYQIRLSNEAQQKLADDQKDSVKRRELLNKIKTLKAEIASLDSRIQEPEDMVARQVQSVQSTWAEMKDCQVKEMLLKAFWQRCYFGHKMLTDNTQKISEECDTLDLTTKCTSLDVLLYLELSDNQYMQSQGKGIPEPQVLREVRKLCDNYLQHSNQNHLQSTISAAKQTAKQQTVVLNQWANDVQSLWSDHPPSHVLAALRQLASMERVDMGQKKASLDKKTGSSSQEPHFRGDNTLDMLTEEEKDLPPVKTLLEDTRKQVEKIWVALARTRTRVQRLRNQFESCEMEAQKKISDESPDGSSTQLALKVALHRVMHAEMRNHIKKRHAELKQPTKSAPQRCLRMKRQYVVTFRKQLIDKRKQIKALVQKNLMARMRIVCLHSELQELIHTKLVQLIKDVITAARFRKNSIFKEARQLRGISLTLLDRRNVEGNERIPASQLSIHHLQSRTFTCLCQELKVPLYKAPGELWACARSKQHKLRYLHWIVQHYDDDLEKVKEKAAWLVSSDGSDFLSEMREEDSKRMKSVACRARSIALYCDENSPLGWKVKSAITRWWSQPAQYAHPRKSQGGATYVQWLQRWKAAVQ